MSVLPLLLLAVGAWLWLPVSSTARLGVPTPSRRSLRGADVAAVSAGLGVAVLMGGLWGAVLGVLVGVGARIGLGMVPADGSDDDVELARQMPDAVDCLAACLAAGAPLWSSITGVAEAFGDPLQQVLGRCVQRRDMGSGAEQTFEPLTQHPALAPVGRVLVRSSESGSALGAALLSCADQLRDERAAVLDRKARAVGVKSVGPLGVCFLPSFVILAVVPIVGSMIQRLL